VIPYEEVRVKDAVARVESSKVVRGQNIHRKGSDAQSGDPLLQPGIVISPAEIALLATVGRTHVSVFKFPSAAIVSTGDELVPVGNIPEPHQVRRSNTYAILAAMESIGWSAESFHLPDNPEVLSGQLKEILANHDVVILSGGVSKGKFDFVPGALEANGISKRFHRVNQRPGKPFWFGTSPDAQKTVFALPGNPVSTYLCFYRYVRPWIRRCHQADEAPLFALLASDFAPPAGITYFLQVSVKNEQGACIAHPDAGGGSGDLANLKDVTGFLEIDGSQGTARKGQAFRYFPFRY
jgi:molybdopterin molybdotransferase